MPIAAIVSSSGLGGGSEPIIREFQDALGVPVVLIGSGLPDDNPHAPNEKLYLPTFYRGIETLVYSFVKLAAEREVAS